MRRPPPRSDRAARAAALAFLLLAAPACPAAEITIGLPTVTAVPGATVLVPLVTSPGPAGLGITAVEFRLDFAPGVLAASASRPDGWLQSWGPAFVNANTAFLAAAAAGFPAASTTGGLLNTLELTVSPTAIPGTDMPLAFQHILVNEGEPAVVSTPGLLRVRTTAAVDDGAAARFALSPPAPNPVARSARFTLTVPAGGEAVRVAIHALDGRLVRELVRGPLAAGRHEVAWDARDDSGAPVRAGLYFATATRGGERVTRRLALAR